MFIFTKVSRALASPLAAPPAHSPQRAAWRSAMTFDRPFGLVSCLLTSLHMTGGAIDSDLNIVFKGCHPLCILGGPYQQFKRRLSELAIAAVVLYCVLSCFCALYVLLKTKPLRKGTR